MVSTFWLGEPGAGSRNLPIRLEYWTILPSAPATTKAGAKRSRIRALARLFIFKAPVWAVARAGGAPLADGSSRGLFLPIICNGGLGPSRRWNIRWLRSSVANRSS